ncbi:stage II sporulation protein M [Paenibacillus kyungheensis]|uniref:Stage II sporulation protein M n=1 Tax=Paenibacillus kyungheensis TaxID=1452732 RepID=A0AAX3LYZ8_9BACL|nr:stage II sporulation protein M [Paenibacillus kyungheensis]WCT55224.1 stage II sporulation protein M [Paenibacillus kyungheensis]
MGSLFSFRTFWCDLKSNRSMLLVSTVLFVVGIIAGILLVEPLGNYLREQLQQLQIVKEQLDQGQHVELNYFVFIFLNNAIKSILIIYLGVFIGIVPVFFLVMNGMIIGFLLRTYDMQGQDVVTLIVKGLLPHGIFEIPAILIAAAYSLKLGKLVLDSLTTWNPTGRYQLKIAWKQFMRSTITASFWIVIILFVAAIIESTITFWLMKA